MYFEPDGEFPDHEPNPLLEQNRRMIMERVTASGADLGIAWDGDAYLAPSSTPGELLAMRIPTAPAGPGWRCGRTPARPILYDPPLPAAPCRTWSRPRAGARSSPESATPSSRRGCARRAPPSAARSPATTTSVTSGDADSGTIPALLMLELISLDGRSLAELMEEFRFKYFISGEINTEVADPEAKMAEIAARYSDGVQTHLDGISVDYEDWHFNVRPSNTEPLLRLNLESLTSREDMGTAPRRGPRADPGVERADSPRGRSSKPPWPVSTVCRSRPRSRSGASTAT